jgi:hypothetical protein
MAVCTRGLLLLFLALSVLLPDGTSAAAATAAGQPVDDDAAGAAVAAARRNRRRKAHSDSLRDASGFTRRLRPSSEHSGKASLLLGAQVGGVLNARDFGATGDGVTDDAPALQKAIDAAQLSRRKLALPAGVYLVNSTLKVHYNGGPAAVQWHNCSFPFDDNLGGPEYCPAALHLVGDGGWGLETIIKAGAILADGALIDVGYGPAGPSVPRGGPSQGHEFHDFMLDAAGKAWHGLRAYAIIRSLVSGLRVEGAIDVGVELGYGFINRVENCNFIGVSNPPVKESYIASNPDSPLRTPRVAVVDRPEVGQPGECCGDREQQITYRAFSMFRYISKIFLKYVTVI